MKSLMTCIVHPYCSVDKMDKNEMGGACSPYGGEERVYRVLVEKPEGKRPLGRPRPRWEDSIKMDVQAVGCESKDWIELAHYRDRWRAVVTVVTNIRAP
jgi:hypothetical protein